MFRFKWAKLFKLALVLSLLILCALLAWALVLFVLGLDLQWWAKAMILTCLGATMIIIVLLRKLWLKRKEMKFVDGIIGSDMPGNISAADDADRELRRRFKEAVVTLKKSHLRGRGNPLYVLPWYLMVGKSGSGKSTAIRSARLPSPFGDINRISGVEGTRNCDWWFFDDSVVIDIAGRYSLHRNEALDRTEWHSFLNHLVRYRKKEPINGIIVTVEADQLLEADPERIEHEGRTIRKRIDEVIHVMGAKFPIYLMVTKCDLVFGMNRFCHLLSEPALDQAMGLMNHDDETDIAVLVDKTMDTIVDKLKDMRLILCNEEEVRDRHYLDPDVLLFPDELARLRKGLMGFCTGAFKDNPFQELPPLRGIYFCSGRQAGRPVLSKADAVSRIGSRELPGTGHGIFLHDFFLRILPGDRFLYAPTRRARDWKRLTGNLWLTAFITVVLLFCIVLTHSWNENKAALNVISPQYRQTLLFENDPVADIAVMIEFGRQIRKIEQINAGWKAPRMGLDASLRLEEDLKKRYCQRFYEHFDADINHRIEGQIANGGWQKNDFEAAVRYIPFIARRINLLKARFDGAGPERLAQLPDPDYALMLFAGDVASADEVLGHYKSAYIDYLTWQQSVEPLNKSLAGMQRLLSNYFSASQGDMRWLVTWANRHLRGQAVTLNHFWHGDSSDAAFAAVGPAFTREGQKLIGHFVLDELEAAVGQTLYIAQPKEQFARWYQDAYFGAWMKFCLDFDKGAALFAADRDWETALESLTGDATPYSRLFDRMDDELLSTAGEDPWPGLKLGSVLEAKYGSWLALIRNFSLVRQAATGQDLTNNPAAGIIGDRAAAKLSGNKALAAKIALGTLTQSRMAKAGEAYGRYRDALAGFAGIATDPKYAYQLVREGFEDNPAQARSQMLAACKAVDSLKIALAPDQPVVAAPAGEDPFWSLLEAPLTRLWQFSVAQAGCHLQTLWDQQVIVKLQGVRAPRQRSTLLFGDQGLVKHFMQSNAAPFVQQSSARGYYVVKRQGAWVPFYGSFFDFVKQGERWWATSGGEIQQAYPVTVAAYPTDVNTEAHIKPYMTRLILEDTEGPTVLENKQYPVEKKFTWLPASDGNVVLQILFENLTLTVRYTGYCAFGQFLKDFSEGYRRFKADCFPDQLTELHRIGVNEIEVTYRMPESQVQPIKRLMRTMPGPPPAGIVRCVKPAR